MTNINAIRSRYKNISEHTKTDIIGAIGFDLEGLDKRDGGEYSKEELVQALRYLLVKNKNLKQYMDTNKTIGSYHYNRSYDPFYIPDGANWFFLGMMMNDHHHHHHHSSAYDNCFGNCGGSGGGGDQDAGAVLACVSVSVAILGFCICSSINTADIVNNERESDNTKLIKIVILALLAAAPSIPLGVYLWDKPKDGFGIENQDYEMLAGFTFHFLLPLLVATASYALFSYIGKNIEIRREPPKPSAELLAQLEVVKRLLETNYVKPGDDPAAVKEFTKEVVRYYIDQISKKEHTLVVAPPPSSPDTERTRLLDERRQLLNSNTLFYQTPSAPSLTEVKVKEDEQPKCGLGNKN